jgi:AraC-like DNA-binding protein
MSQSIALNPACVLAGYVHFPPGGTLRFTRVQSRCILCCKTGTGTIYANEQVIPFSRGVFVFLPWNHRIVYQAGPDRSMTTVGAHIIPVHSARPMIQNCSHFEDDPFSNLPGHADADLPGLNGIVSGCLHMDRPLIHLLEYAATLMMRPRTTISGDTAKWLGREMINELYETLREDPLPVAGAPAHLQKVVNHIQENLSEEFNLSSLAFFAGVSVDSLIRHWKKYLGLTPGNWILRQRLERAAYLLQTTQARSQEIGVEVGIPDPYYFSRAFKKHFGQSPSTFRKRGILG